MSSWFHRGGYCLRRTFPLVLAFFLLSEGLSAESVPITRLYVAGGYPMLINLPLLGQSPDSLVPGGKMPLGAFKGTVGGELGLVPGFEIPWGLELALMGQFFHGGGEIPQYGGSVPSVKMNFYSMGGGMRVDKPFWIGSVYGVAPLFGLYIHYQNFYRTGSGGGTELVTTAPSVEIGLNQFLRFGKEGWRIVLGTVAGSFLYGGQNMAYFRMALGVEYAYF